jgi:hypothetical protein
VTTGTSIISSDLSAEESSRLTGKVPRQARAQRADIYDHAGEDYMALTKVFQGSVQMTTLLPGIKPLVTTMQGTDILTYESDMTLQ